MKFKNPQGKEIGEVATMVGGLVLGAIVSRGVISAIHTPTAGADATTSKKESTMLLVKRGAIVLASGYAGAGINGNDAVTTVVKGMCYGMATMQAIDGIKDVASTNASLSDTSTKTKRVIANSLGLGCACDTPVARQWMNAARRKSRLSMPAIAERPGAFSVNPLEVAYNNSSLVN